MALHYLLRYGEIALKGQNQRYFVDSLMRNLERAVADLGRVEIRHAFGRVILTADGEPDILSERLRKVFGVVSLSPIRIVPPELDQITAAALELVGETLTERPEIHTFKVDTRRAEKRFPLTSMETSSEVGAAVRQRYPALRAQMQHPDLLLQIEIRDATYLTTKKIPGPGGLPVGTGGRALALISGGIDSPVAAWMGARRGLIVTPVHFHSFPFTSERSKEKVVDLSRVLASYTGPLWLWVVYFTDILRAIQLQVPDPLRVLVMRRMMMRVCDRLAEREKAQALITGESLGQVASQTIQAIAVINAATRLPVLRPLIGTDKTEIVAHAVSIGTYDISIRPYEDCCTLFISAHPRTQPDLEEVAAAEQGLDIPALIEEALARSERMRIIPYAAPVPLTP